MSAIFVWDCFITLSTIIYLRGLSKRERVLISWSFSQMHMTIRTEPGDWNSIPRRWPYPSQLPAWDCIKRKWSLEPELGLESSHPITMDCWCFHRTNHWHSTISSVKPALGTFKAKPTIPLSHSRASFKTCVTLLEVNGISSKRWLAWGMACKLDASRLGNETSCGLPKSSSYLAFPAQGCRQDRISCRDQGVRQQGSKDLMDVLTTSLILVCHRCRVS